MATTNELLTAEQFAQLPPDGVPRELVQGEVIATNLPGARHGKICAAIARILGNHVVERDCGHVMSNDAGVLTRRNPDSVRGPDVLYYSYQRMPADAVPERYHHQTPELVFEVLSPDDRWANVFAKVAEYLQANVLAVCVVDPDAETITVYTQSDAPQVYSRDDALHLPQVLPDWQPSVSSLLSR